MAIKQFNVLSLELAGYMGANPGAEPIRADLKKRMSMNERWFTEVWGHLLPGFGNRLKLGHIPQYVCGAGN